MNNKWNSIQAKEFNRQKSLKTGWSNIMMLKRQVLNKKPVQVRQNSLEVRICHMLQAWSYILQIFSQKWGDQHKIKGNKVGWIECKNRQIILGEKILRREIKILRISRRVEKYQIDKHQIIWNLFRVKGLKYKQNIKIRLLNLPKKLLESQYKQFHLWKYNQKIKDY